MNMNHNRTSYDSNGLGSTDEAEPRTMLQWRSSDLMRYIVDLSQVPHDGEEIEDNIKLQAEPNHNCKSTFPSLEEHDMAKMLFELNINKSNGSWYYSSELGKVFIRRDSPFYIQLTYQQRPEIGDIGVRVMMVFSDDIGSPIKRCSNHKFAGKDLSDSVPEAFLESLIRCENPNVLYAGTATGKSVNDRLSIWIPLGFLSPDENNFVRQIIALKFVCQNSCIGRKSTALIFTLETRSGEVLSKRIINVKICSCPKRDKEKEENKILEMKPKAEKVNLPSGKKPLKIRKINKEASDPAQLLFSDSDLPNDGGIKKLIMMPDEESMRSILTLCLAEIAKRMVLDKENADKYVKYLKYYKNMIDSDLKKALD